MTNREKLNKMSNEELARFIANERCEEFYRCDKQCVPPKEDDIKGITNWLSQEAEEDKKITILNMPKDENTAKAIEYILQHLSLSSERIDKLEKCQNNCNDIQLSGYSYGSIEKDKTADKMFEELEYKKDYEYSAGDVVRIKYHSVNSGFIEIIIEGENYAFSKNCTDGLFINKLENEAIYKKIKELKNATKV